MAEMTSHERFRRMFEHREADRVPIIDSPWAATIERWRREGMPEDASFAEYFGLDHVAHIGADNSPRYPETLIEETEEYRITTTRWGQTVKNWKHAASTPGLLACTVTDPDSWRKAKRLMRPTRDRVDWARLAGEYPAWRRNGRWIVGHLWFGFDVTHARLVGTERLLVAMIEQPEWVAEMFHHYLDVNLALLEMVWQAGYTFDAVQWPDDMGYKHRQFFSVRTYRELLKPAHKRAIDWAHAKGIYAELHSCGDVNPFVGELIEIGLDGLNPMEVKAGMDPAALKRAWGDRLLLHGGINAMLWDDLPAIEAEMRRLLPVMKEGGGYVFSSDHSIPSSVSLEGFRRIVKLAKELGAY